MRPHLPPDILLERAFSNALGGAAIPSPRDRRHRRWFGIALHRVCVRVAGRHDGGDGVGVVPAPGISSVRRTTYPISASSIPPNVVSFPQTTETESRQILLGHFILSSVYFPLFIPRSTENSYMNATSNGANLFRTPKFRNDYFPLL